MIPKDVTICDWHYERDDPTAPYFAMKGFHVVTCPWNSPPTAILQADDMAHYRSRSPAELRERFQGVVQTVWSPAGVFLDKKRQSRPDKPNSWQCFTALFKEIKKLARETK